jgi:hypothetical protein
LVDPDGWFALDDDVVLMIAAQQGPAQGKESISYFTRERPAILKIAGYNDAIGLRQLQICDYRLKGRDVGMNIC